MSMEELALQLQGDLESLLPLSMLIVLLDKILDYKVSHIELYILLPQVVTNLRVIFLNI